MYRRKMPAHVRIVELGLGCSAEKVAVNLRWHVPVTINGAADKLHFERVKSFAVADGCQSVRMHRLADNARRNLLLFRGRRATQTEKCDNNKRSVALHGVSQGNCLSSVFQRAQASSRACRFSSLASGFSPSRMNPCPAPPYTTGSYFFPARLINSCAVGIVTFTCSSFPA